MPFGCISVRNEKTYNCFSDITDKYEIGQLLCAKEFCEICLAREMQTDRVYVCKKFLKKDGRKVRRAAKNEIMILKMDPWTCVLQLLRTDGTSCNVYCWEHISIILLDKERDLLSPDERFMAYRRCSLVNHPNILQLIDTFETKKEFYIIQELATGGDVFDWILEQGYYSEKDASNVIRQVLEAVAYLHNLHIIHRNLKLENLMYYNQNNHSKVVLRDFYLSCFESGEITEPCGTPEYLAPEVVSRHRYGRPVDCWAVGVVMFILLSGNPPFYDENEEENSENHNRKIFRKILAGEYEFDSPYWDVISASAKDLVSRLMEMDQEQRITAQEALGHIWISGNAASERNLKEGVCAQIEKNFAKAKWRKAIRVTTFMQRLRASEGTAGRLPVTPRSSMSVSHEVTVEACPSPQSSPSQHSIPKADWNPSRVLQTTDCGGHSSGQPELGGPP